MFVGTVCSADVLLNSIVLPSVVIVPAADKTPEILI
jgi:hypothetical protein